MMKWLLYRLKLAHLRYRVRWLRRAFAKDIKNARAEQKPLDIIRGIREDEHFEWKMLRDDIYVHQSDYLTASASDLFLDRNTSKDDWVDSQTGRNYLTLSAMNRINQAIRKEKKEQREAWLIFVPALGGLTGLIGAIIGLVALFLKK